MRTNNKARNSSKKSEGSEKPNRSPVCSFTTPWFRGNLGFFHVNLGVVGPIPQEPQGYLPLSRSEAKRILEAISDQVELLKKELR